MDSRCGHHGTDRTTGDNASSLRCRLQHDTAGGVLSMNFVRDGSAEEGNLNQMLLRVLSPLAN